MDLRNASVYVVGASVGSSNVTLDTYQNLQEFWVRYFDAVNAHLDRANFGAALVKF